MRITGLAVPYEQVSHRQQKFAAGAIQAVAERPLPLVAGHKTAPDVIGRIVDIDAHDTGVTVVAELPDDYDIEGLAFSVEVAPWQMFTLDGVEVINVATLHRVALTNDPAFTGTEVHKLDEEPQ